MIKHEHAHRPHKLISKIHKQLKRCHELYWPATTSYNWNTSQREDVPGKWKNVHPELVEEMAERIAHHLWYEHLGMDKDTLRALVVQEHQTMKLLELIE